MEDTKRQKQEKRPCWKTCLWLIPKNLVYVFALAIVFSFGAMCWITYTDRNMQDFFFDDAGTPNNEPLAVDPLFMLLKQSMRIKP